MTRRYLVSSCRSLLLLGVRSICCSGLSPQAFRSVLITTLSPSASGCGNIASGADLPLVKPLCINLSRAERHPYAHSLSGPISSSLLKSSLFEGGRGSYGLHGYGSTLLYAGPCNVRLLLSAAPWADRAHLCFVRATGLMNLAGAVSVVLYRTPKKKP